MTSGQNHSARQWNFALALLVSAVVIALHLRLWQHAGGLWRDEANLVNLASHSTLADMAHDSFPVFMPLAVHVWLRTGLGQTDFGLRSLGALVGIFLVAALWLNSRQTRRAPPLVSLALLALNPVAIAYGDSLRAYGLGSAFIVLAAAAAWTLLQKPLWSRAVFFALAATLSVQSLFQNAVLVLAVCLGAFAVSWRRKDFRAMLQIFCGGLLAAVSLLPYLPNLLATPTAAASLRVGFQPDVVRDNLQLALGFPLAAYFWAWLALTVIAISTGLRKFYDRANEHQLFAAVTLLAALGGFGGFLWLAALPTQTWYFLPLMALAAACFDAGLPELPAKFHAAAFGLVAATALAATPFAWREAGSRFTNADLLAAQISASAAPQDMVIVSPWYCGISFDRYFRSAAPWTTLPPLADHATHRYDLVQLQMKNPAALAPVLEKISATLRGGHRVWVVGWLEIPPPGSPAPQKLPPPPLKFSGWADTPYDLNWAAQAAHFLRRHAPLFEQAKTDDDAVRDQERLALFVAQGWRD